MLCIDQSSGASTDLLTVVQRFLATHPVRKLGIVLFDCRVNNYFGPTESRLELGHYLGRYNPTGRGGTNLDPALELCRNKGFEVVVISDGYYPKPKSDVPFTLWKI